jgi:glycosidase
MKGDGMTLLRRLLVLAVSTVACGALSLSHTQPIRNSDSAQSVQASDQSAPAIDKIDPPGWFAGLPDPMLLVHGQGLQKAQFAVQGERVKLVRTQASANGHWAFLWIETGSATAQTLQVTAVNDRGQAQKPFTLAERSHDSSAHRGFSSADVLYLIMTDRFADGNQANDPPGDDRAAPRGWHGGNFAGIEQHLDYLQQLGVTTLWTTPVASNGNMPESYHGYAATDLYAVDSHFGTLNDYRRLSDALHARGMKLVIDLVPNHLGVQHPWVLDPPAPEWFHGTLDNHRPAAHNFYQLVDPHAPIHAWSDITDGWFTDAMPDLNQENPMVSRYLIQNALWWVETANLDGIRLDTFPYVGRAFWHEFHAALHGAYPHLTTVGEIFHRDPEVTSFFAGEVTREGIDTGLDTPFDFPIYFKLRDVLVHGQPMSELAKVLRQDSLYPHPERLVTFIGNHDTTRFFTDVNGSVTTLKLALGLVITLRGMPQIYSGDEIGMTGEKDPDNRHDFPGGFVGDPHNAFTKAGRSAKEEELFAWTSGLLSLRSAHPVLQTGMEQNLFADQDVFVFVRSPDGTGCAADHSTERIMIVVNKAQRSRVLQIAVNQTALDGCTMFLPLQTASGVARSESNGELHVEERAESMAIFAVR